MKKTIFIILFIILSIVFTGCSDTANNSPDKMV